MLMFCFFFNSFYIVVSDFFYFCIPKKFATFSFDYSVVCLIGFLQTYWLSINMNHI